MKTKTDVTNKGAIAETKRSVAKVISDWLGRTELMFITMRRHEALGRLAYEPTNFFLRAVTVYRRQVHCSVSK